MANDTAAYRNNVIDIGNYISLDKEFSITKKKSFIWDDREFKIFLESVALVFMTVVAGAALFFAFDKLIDVALYLAP